MVIKALPPSNGCKLNVFAQIMLFPTVIVQLTMLLETTEESTNKKTITSRIFRAAVFCRAVKFLDGITKEFVTAVHEKVISGEMPLPALFDTFDISFILCYN